MIDPTVWNSIILRITAEQYHFLNRELGITKAKLKLTTLQDVSELIDDLASIAFYEFNNEHQRTARADLALKGFHTECPLHQPYHYPCYVSSH